VPAFDIPYIYIIVKDSGYFHPQVITCGITKVWNKFNGSVKTKKG